MVREFDLPILSNEEAMADAFATHYLTMHMPDRALDVLMARTTSLMIEAGELPRDQWPISGEHESDARRAFQIAAWAIAADPAKYAAPLPRQHVLAAGVLLERTRHYIASYRRCAARGQGAPSPKL